MDAAAPIHWPRNDYSRVPYRLYHDADIYAQEMVRIFRGPVWLFLGLEAEVPNAGDFRTTWLGETPVVYDRDDDGQVYAFVNRCAHRGATVCRELYGNSADHTCIYHRWCYDRRGNLIGIPFKRGVGGKGGLSPDFEQGAHGLEKLRVESYCGVLFATFANDNLRDLYHGTLLHEFQTTFAIARVTQEGGADMDPRHRHNLSWAKEGTDDDADAHEQYQQANVREGVLTLEAPDFVTFRPEYADGISISICSVFPNACFQQIRNSLATRQIRPKGTDSFELVFTIFGYASDTPEMTRHRLLQANLVGPAGLISMEDGEAVEIAHRSTLTDQGACNVIEMGGRGKIGDSVEFGVTDVPMRGFWSYYAELMGCEPPGAIR